MHNRWLSYAIVCTRSSTARLCQRRRAALAGGAAVKPLGEVCVAELIGQIAIRTRKALERGGCGDRQANGKSARCSESRSGGA